MKCITPRLAIIALAASALSFLGSAGAQTLVYSNTTTFTGQGATNGGVTSDTGTRQTNLVADDLTYDPAFALNTVTRFTFSLANFNSTSQALTPSIRFYSNDGANGGPGTLLAGFNFGAITMAAGSVNTFSFNIPAANQFPLPATGTLWAGMYFSSGSQTAAVMNNFGQAIFNPPTIGSSADRAFFGSTPGTQTTGNPAGSVVNSPFSGNPVANFGWQITAVPEPSTVAFVVFGVGLLVAGHRLKRKR